jgi:hypothetical protein
MSSDTSIIDKGKRNAPNIKIEPNATIKPVVLKKNKAIPIEPIIITLNNDITLFVLSTR